MPASLQLRVTHGPGKGTTFTFASHDTFLLGRNADCHAHLPDDTRVSPHHFLLEACPPQAILRNLGSPNGTHVNGQKHGGRQPGETPEQGARRRYPEIALKQGDRTQSGDPQLEVHIHQPVPKQAKSPSSNSLATPSTKNSDKESLARGEWGAGIRESPPPTLALPSRFQPVTHQT
jgi:pSer/pThr/pTyr-binding forkhead associated (FHA) protein